MIPVCLPNIASCAVWVQSGSLRQNFSAPHCLSSLPLTAIKPPLCSFYTGLNCRTLSIFSVCILFRKANGNEMSLKPDRTWTTHPPSLWNVNEQQQGRQLLKRTPERPLQLHWVAGGMWVVCETPPALTNSKSNAIGLVLLSTVKKTTQLNIYRECWIRETKEPYWDHWPWGLYQFSLWSLITGNPECGELWCSDEDSTHSGPQRQRRDLMSTPDGGRGALNYWFCPICIAVNQRLLLHLSLTHTLCCDSIVRNSHASFDY